MEELESIKTFATDKNVKIHKRPPPFLGGSTTRGYHTTQTPMTREPIDDGGTTNI